MARLEERIRDAEARLLARYDVSCTEHRLDLKVEGAPLCVRVLEVGSGDPVVLLHPATWFGAHWAPLIPQLPGRRLLCVDFPGHGLSGTVDYRQRSVRQHTVVALQQLWSALGLGSVPVLGSSLGGMSALWLAVAHPELVSRLVIFGVPAMALPGSRLDLGLKLLTIPGLNRILMSLPSSPTGSRRISRAAFGPTALERTPDEAFEVHYLTSRRPELVTMVTTALPAGTRWFAAKPYMVLTDAELADLPQPARFIWGDRDIFGGPEVGRRAASLMRDATFSVHPGGHFPQLDDPELCGKLVSEFLGDGPGMAQ